MGNDIAPSDVTNCEKLPHVTHPLTILNTIKSRTIVAGNNITKRIYL